MRKRWERNVGGRQKAPGYISQPRLKKKGDCRDETPDSPCICTHPPDNIHYISWNNGSSGEDPYYPAPSVTSSPEAASMCKGMEKNHTSWWDYLQHFLYCPLSYKCILLKKILQLAPKCVRFNKNISLKTKTLRAQHIQWHHYLISILWFFPLFTPSLEHKSSVTTTQCIILPWKATQPYNNLSLAIMSSHTNDKNLSLNA